MPFKSEKQRRFMWSQHPSIAERWAHEYPHQKNLPRYVGDKRTKSSVRALVKSKSRKMGSGDGKGGYKPDILEGLKPAQRISERIGNLFSRFKPVPAVKYGNYAQNHLPLAKNRKK